MVKKGMKDTQHLCEIIQLNPDRFISVPQHQTGEMTRSGTVAMATNKFPSVQYSN